MNVRRSLPAVRGDIRWIELETSAGGKKNKLCAQGIRFWSLAMPQPTAGLRSAGLQRQLHCAKRAMFAGLACSLSIGAPLLSSLDSVVDGLQNAELACLAVALHHQRLNCTVLLVHKSSQRCLLTSNFRSSLVCSVVQCADAGVASCDVALDRD